MDVNGHVHARDKVEVIQGTNVLEADLDRNDLSDFLEVPRALGSGLREQREHRRGTGLNLQDPAGE
jgi:hypothetical protein